MWGIWFILLISATVGVVALLIGLAAGAAPIFAAVIFVVVAIVLVAIASFRRSAEYVRHTESTTRGRRSPQSGGSPASGEGGGAQTGAAATPGERGGHEPTRRETDPARE